MTEIRLACTHLIMARPTSLPHTTAAFANRVHSLTVNYGQPIFDTSTGSPYCDQYRCVSVCGCWCVRQSR